MTPETLEFGQVQELTDRLKELVRKYPKGVGIFKEFLQNADDAGASSLRMVLDCQTYSSNRLPPEMAVLQGPSLVFVNDRPFSDDDWKRIQQIGNSGKAHDVQKTGRFGLGFNSVYNVTDHPMLLTNGHLGVFDPHKNVVARAHSKPGAAWRIDQLAAAQSELLTPFLCYGLDLQSDFRSTVFRLPLRTSVLASSSKISSEAFSSGDFDDIVSGIVDQGGGLLLFLHNLLYFQLEIIQQNGLRRQVLSVETLNPDVVEQQRAKIRGCVDGSLGGTLDYLELIGPEEVCYEHRLRFNHSAAITDENWAIVRGVYASDELLTAAKEMEKVDEKAVPIAGAALNLEQPVENGRLSCALPLPTGSGIPIHVDGFFDLQDSRQDLHQDETATGQTSQTRINWNRVLLRDGCAAAAASLLVHVGENNETPQYAHWPGRVVAENRLVDSLPKMIYGHLSQLKCISAGPSTSFVQPHQVYLAPPTLRAPLLADGLLCENPTIPPHVRTAFKAFGAELHSLTPSALREHLRAEHWHPCPLEESPRASLRQRDWISELLSFCLKDEAFHEFSGVPLALMADGTLHDFDAFASTPLYIGDEIERRLLAELAGIFVDEVLALLGVERLPGVASIALADIVNQLPRLFDEVPEQGYVCANDDEYRKPANSWLIDFYNYCAIACERESLKQMPGRDALAVMPLVPDSENDLWCMGTANTPVFETSRRQTQWKQALLDAAGRYFATTTGEIGNAIKEFRSSFTGDEIPPFSPRLLAELLSDTAVREKFLTDSSVAKQVVSYLLSNKVSAWSGNTGEQLSQLPMFPLANGELTAIRPTPVYVSVGFSPPSVGFDIRVLDASDAAEAEMFVTLGAKRLTREQYVVDFFLKSFEDLKPDDQSKAMHWFRAEYYSMCDSATNAFADGFAEQVAQAEIVLCEDCEVRAADSIYHPSCQNISAILGAPIHYPHPELYGSKEWLDFFGSIGMESTIRAADVVQAIDHLIDQPFDNRIATQLQQIASFIDQNWSDLHDKSVDGQLFVDMLNQRDWLPVIAKCPNDYPDALFLKPTRDLYAPAEISHSLNRNRVASVLPVCRFPTGANLSAALQFHILTFEDLLQHFDNAITIAESQGAGKHLIAVFQSIYQSLGQSILSDEIDFDGSTLTPRYQHRKCLVGGGQRMWAPQDCFRRSADLFLGMRTRVSFTDPAMEACATALGRADAPELKDYRRFFCGLAESLAGNPVPDDQLATLANAYRKAASLRKTSGDLADCSVLTEKGILRSPDNVLIDDAPWLSDRAHESNVEFLYESLGEQVALAFAVGQLSTVVSERILSSEPSPSGDLGEICDLLNKTIQSNEFANGLFRLMPAGKRNRNFVERLREFKVIAASSIVTQLFWDDVEIEGSEGRTDFVFDRGVFYTDEIKKRVLQSHVASTLVSRYFAEYALTDESAIQMMLDEEVTEIDSLLDQLRIANLSEDELMDFAEANTLPANDGMLNSYPSVESDSAVGVGRSSTATFSGGVGNSSQAVNAGNHDASAAPPKDSPSIGSPTPRGSRSQSSRSSPSNNRRAVTYVGGESQLNKPTTGQHSQRESVDLAAVTAVIVHETEEGRLPTEMEHFNEGYDVESRLTSEGEVVRYIETKGLGGAWGDLGVKLTPAQLRFGQKHGNAHWLYVVEFAMDDERRLIHKLQNPVQAITDYRFDSGWKQLCTESTGIKKKEPEIGSRVVVEQKGEGMVVEAMNYGKSKRLQIKFDSGDESKVSYPSPRITVLE